MLARILGSNIGRETVLGLAASAVGVAASVTFPAQGGTKLEITKVIWSYSGDPAAGNLSMTGPVVAPDVDITKGGPGALSGFGAIIAPTNVGITVTLASGGGGVTGKLYVEAVRRPS